MNVIPRNGRIIDRILDDNARAAIADQKAVIDYNVMMGIIEDPAEEGEADAGTL